MNEIVVYALCKKMGGQISDSTIQEAINKYLQTHPLEKTPVDTTLTQSGQAADAKIVGNLLNNISNKVGNIPNDKTIQSYIDDSVKNVSIECVTNEDIDKLFND